MLAQNNNLIRLFGVLKTIADFGSAATADRDFAETASDILKRTIEALDALQGALFVFDHGVVRLTVLACSGFDFLTPKAGVHLGRSQSQKWLQSRGAQLLGPDGVADYFGAQETPFLHSLKCLLPLQMGPTLVGGLCLGNRKGNEAYGDMEKEALDLLGGHLALLLQNYTLSESLRLQITDNLRLLSSLNHSYDDALEAFATTIDARNEHMRGHSMRVGRFATGIATSLGMSDADIPGIRAAGQLHDIGMVTVEKSLSTKSSPLRPEEFREIADHTIIGHQIVLAVRFPWPQVPDVVRWHHERADGSGYPDNLRNDDVSLPVRIIAVADSFDAMTSERPFRKSHTVLEAAEELVRLTPSKYDADVVQALLVQLRWNFQGKGTMRLSPSLNGIPVAPADLDKLSMALVHKATGHRVYSA